MYNFAKTMFKILVTHPSSPKRAVLKAANILISISAKGNNILKDLLSTKRYIYKKVKQYAVPKEEGKNQKGITARWRQN